MDVAYSIEGIIYGIFDFLDNINYRHDMITAYQRDELDNGIVCETELTIDFSAGNFELDIRYNDEGNSDIYIATSTLSTFLQMIKSNVIEEHSLEIEWPYLKELKAVESDIDKEIIHCKQLKEVL